MAKIFFLFFKFIVQGGAFHQEHQVGSLASFFLIPKVNVCSTIDS